MPSVTLGPDELVRRGQDYYERVLRAKLDPAHRGEFLAIEVESGDYALGKSTLDALDKAEAKHPDSVFYIMRVGYRTAGRIGAPVAGAKT
ncbi:MAG: hypothetical protein FJ291_31085 [Planctomycetes bacterium]|nr:hypothetical protein [Planctomycetota bacterium]